MIASELYPGLDCGKCDARQKLQRGCNVDEAELSKDPVLGKLKGWWTDQTGARRSRCPRRPILDNPIWFSRLIGAYNSYKAGFLPHPGGMDDQASLFPLCMQIIDGTHNWCYNQRQKMEEAKAARSNPSGGMSLLHRD